MDRDQTLEVGFASVLPAFVLGMSACFAAGGLGLVGVGWLGEGNAIMGLVGASWLVALGVIWIKMNIRLRFRGNSECLHVEEKKGARVLCSGTYAWKEISACDLVHYRDENDLLPGEETGIGKLLPPMSDGRLMAHYRCRLTYQGRPVTILCSLREGDALRLCALIMRHKEAFAAPGS